MQTARCACKLTTEEAPSSHANTLFSDRSGGGRESVQQKVTTRESNINHAEHHLKFESKCKNERRRKTRREQGRESASESGGTVASQGQSSEQFVIFTN